MKSVSCNFLVLPFLFPLLLAGQLPSKAVLQKKKNIFSDSLIDPSQFKAGLTIAMQDAPAEADEGDHSKTIIPSLLGTGKDLFAQTAAFHFSIRRFRLKGFEPALSLVYLNNIPMNQLTDGNAVWSSWSGLNEVMTNTRTIIGLRDNEYAFGSPGTAGYVDLKASLLREQTTVTVALSNRNYQYRLAFTKIKGFNKKGWAFAISTSIRMGNNAVFDGTFHRSHSYFLAIDKKVKQHLFSFCVLGSQLLQTRATAITKETVSLYQSTKYNPSWGYQQEQKRSANMQFLHYPIAIFSHEHRSENDNLLIQSIAYSAGERYITGIDWYKATDPRPDYYRYLPSFQTDSSLRAAVTAGYLLDRETMQLNWARMYAINRNSIAFINDVNGIRGNSFSGKRARYIVEDRVEQAKKFTYAIRTFQQLGEGLFFTANAGIQLHQYRYFKRVNDLLGAEFYVNWNQFADDNIPDAITKQNDVNQPNRILFVGDVFGYDYQFTLQKMQVASQLVYQSKRVDFFAAFELSEIQYKREGFVRNGVFLLNSFGASAPDKFSGYAIKGGGTYKINGREYAYIHHGFFSKPPVINDLYISPRTRDTRHPIIQMEQSFITELGYILNAPSIKFRVNCYAAYFKNGMSVLSFYHDGYRNLVNYALGNINQLHIGVETSATMQLNERLRFNSSVGYGRYTFTSRQSYSIAIDNENFVSETGSVYTKNFPVTGTPQQVYSCGFTYQSPDNLFLDISFNYLANYWVSFNPIRRTYEGLRNLAVGAETAAILYPEKLPNIFVTDFSAGYSFPLSAYSKKIPPVVQLFLSVNNLLNQPVITGGYEQLRYDVDNANIHKFPSKYYYQPGALYSLSIRLKL